MHKCLPNEERVRQKWICSNSKFPVCRFANLGGLGFQEKLVLKKKIDEATEKGEAPPDMPGMDKMIEEMKHPEKFNARQAGLQRPKE